MNSAVLLNVIDELIFECRDGFPMPITLLMLETINCETLEYNSHSIIRFENIRQNNFFGIAFDFPENPMQSFND
jgi:hypothetical protein